MSGDVSRGGGSDRLRVLWFANTASGGAEVVGRTTAGGGWIRGLEERIAPHVDLTVAFLHPEDRAGYRLGGVDFRPVATTRTHPAGKAYNRVTGALESSVVLDRLAAVVDQVNPDVIHVHGTEGPFGLVQALTRVPVLVSLQAVMSVYELKYFSGLERVALRRGSAVATRLGQNTYADRFRRFRRQAEREREILAMTRHVAGRTAWDRRAASILAPNATYHHLGEVLRSPFYEQKWEPPDTQVVQLVTTTGPNPYKGFETLVRAASLLEEAGVDYRWRVAGLSQADPLVNVVLSALSTKLPARVELLGTLSEERLVEELLSASIYVGVSHIENSPNSLCEAQLLGLPCLATAAGGTPSIVGDGVDGVLVQDGDPYALAGAVLELARDPEAAWALGQAGRQTALARHDREQVTAATLAIYAELVSG